MFHIKTIVSVAVSTALYAMIYPCTSSASSDSDQILLSANKHTQRNGQFIYRQQVSTSRNIQQQDRLRDRQRLDPQGTPNEDPPSKTDSVDLQDDKQHDRIRDRLRLDPKGTPNEDPPSKTDSTALLSDQQHDRVRDRLREDPQGMPNENPPSKDD